MEGIQVTTQILGANNDIALIRVGGYIDTTTSSEVERALNNLLKQGYYKIIIDLGDVDYISSAGWGIFISEIKSIRENGGDLYLVRMIPDVYEIFELLEFHHILDVYDSVEEAVQRFEARAAGQVVEPVAQEARVEEVAHVQAEPRGGPTVRESAPKAVPEAARAEQQPVAAAPAAEKPAEAAAQSSKVKDISEMNIEEKIQYIVAREPKLGAFRIHRRLNSPEFGFTNVGWLGVRRYLKQLGLSSRKEREAYAASVQF
ncbi:MAG: anti-sigma factor antagonist [Calditrichaeota bacterium]|nr:MAG: anti-sigma factor antagonist [Calditrichota bacterium]